MRLAAYAGAAALHPVSGSSLRPWHHFRSYPDVSRAALRSAPSLLWSSVCAGEQAMVSACPLAVRTLSAPLFSPGLCPLESAGRTVLCVLRRNSGSGAAYCRRGGQMKMFRGWPCRFRVYPRSGVSFMGDCLNHSAQFLRKKARCRKA